MGSGFLVSAPLLAGLVGNFALIVMAALLLLAYAVGSVMRFNIEHFEPIEIKREIKTHRSAQNIAFLSRIVLTGAYFVSVAYYLQLLSAFFLSSIGMSSNKKLAPLITTLLLVTIGVIGMWKGLERLMSVEKYAVSLNLGMVGALIVALAFYNGGLMVEGKWLLPEVEATFDYHNLRVLLGLLIVVQGFETSRYLGDVYKAKIRIKTMRWAQLISAMIYLLFIGLVTVLFHNKLGSDVTAIITLTAPIATILPLLISIAAIGSQFSAAVADTEGAGGSLEDITRHKAPLRYNYLLIMLVTIFITWETNVNQIISYASRAFALYYTLQCGVALCVAYKLPTLKGRHFRLLSYFVLLLICLVVFILGIPSE
jgi:hypothetical protein